MSQNDNDPEIAAFHGKQNNVIKENSPRENWSIYVDETYFRSVQSEQKIDRFITGFFAVADKNYRALENNYLKTVYTDTLPNTEIKSSYVSDQLNVKALMATRGWDALYKVRLAPRMLPKENQKQNAFLTAYRYANYVLPTISIIKKIIEQTHAQQLNVKIHIDHRDEMEQGTAFYKYCNEILYMIKHEIQERTDCLLGLSLDLVNSQENIGVQVADMLCGAARKQLLYSEFEPNNRLIPFKYELDKEPVDVLWDKGLMYIYGVIERLETEQKENIKRKYSLKIENRASDRDVIDDHYVINFAPTSENFKIGTRIKDLLDKANINMPNISLEEPENSPKNSDEVNTPAQRGNDIQPKVIGKIMHPIMPLAPLASEKEKSGDLVKPILPAVKVPNRLKNTTQPSSPAVPKLLLEKLNKAEELLDFFMQYASFALEQDINSRREVAKYLSQNANKLASIFDKLAQLKYKKKKPDAVLKTFKNNLTRLKKRLDQIDISHLNLLIYNLNVLKNSGMPLHAKFMTKVQN